MSIKDKLHDFQHGVAILRGGKSREEKLLAAVRGFIPFVGVDVVRKQVIKATKGDMKRAIKKNRANPQEAIESIIQKTINKPDQMVLLKELDMDESHLRILAQEVLNED